ncbi:acyl-CoA N-acyltransferase [Aspergillus unguis]
MTEPILALPASKTLIRPFISSDDTVTLSTQANNPLIAQYMRNAFPSPYTLTDAENWIAFTGTQNPRYDFVIAEQDTNSLIGAIGLKPRIDVHHRSMEIGYWVAEGHWGLGIASEAVRLFSAWAFQEFRHVVRLDAEVFEGNRGSARVLEKAGYVFEGRKRRAVEKGGVVLDTLVYALVRDDL